MSPSTVASGRIRLPADRDRGQPDPVTARQPTARFALVATGPSVAPGAVELLQGLRVACQEMGVTLLRLEDPTDLAARERLRLDVSAFDIIGVRSLDGGGHGNADPAQVVRVVESRCRTGSVALEVAPPADGAAAHASGLPVLSVVIPVRNGGQAFAACLERLRASDLPRAEWELIVVDDGSADASLDLALEDADIVVRLPRGTGYGPAFARNRGAELSRAPYILFLDADTRVSRTTLRLAVERIEADPAFVAVAGAYAATLPVNSLAARYRTLLDHHQHAACAGEIDSFFGACGVVRRDAFLRSGMWDEWRFQRPQIEDIELGHRLRTAGGRIRLDLTLAVEHSKAWTVPALLIDEFRDRTIPGARVLGPNWNVFRAPSMLAAKRQYSVVVASCIAILAAMVQLVAGGFWWAGALAGGTYVVVLEAPLFRTFRKYEGHRFLLQAAPLHVVVTATNGVAYAVGRALSILFGEPRPHPLVEAWAEVGLQSWPPMPRQPKPVDIPT